MNKIERGTVTSKGQITIPKKIREDLGLKKGTKVSFILREDEVVLIPEPEDPIEDLKSMRDEIKFTQNEIDEMIEKSKKEWSKI